MRKVIVLLDVDDTCAVSNSLYGQHNGGYRYNEALFQALKANNLTEIYLFTSYSLRAVAPNNNLEPETTPSRLKLISHLRQQGITVLGVLTNFDCEYQQGAGAYYEKVIKPYESLVLQGEDIRSEKHKKVYEAKCLEEEVFRKAGFEHKTDTKVSLYRYLLEQLKNSFFHSDYVFVVVDDSKGTIADLRACYSTETPLLAILARPQLTMQNYQTEISDFLYKTRLQDLKLKLEPLSKHDNKELHEKRLFETLKSLEQKRNNETLQSFTHQLEQFSCTIVEPGSKVAQEQPFSTLDPDSKKLQEEILSLAEPKGPEGTQARVQGFGEPFYISIANARKILSQNEKGVVEKNNEYGNNPVSKLGNVYYKGNPEHFLTEQAVYQMSLLLGGGILSPTRLLSIEIAGEERVPIQASLAVQGENLEHILRLPGGIAGLKKKLGAERFQQEFPVLLKELYLTDWLSNKGYELAMPWEGQIKLLTETIFALPLAERPKNFQDPKLIQERLEKKLFESKLKGAPILATLALMARYPELTHGVDLRDLLHIPDLFKILKRLYPKDTPEQILKQLPELFGHFVPENISKHFLLALLSGPRDHKGDNFMVKILHDPNGKLQSLEIIGIDNDMAGIDNELGMEGSIRAWKLRNGAKLQYDINVKSVFYGAKEFLNMGLSSKLVKSPEDSVVDWLGNMVGYVQCYLPLLTRGLYQAHFLHQQILVNFVERFVLRWNKIQKIIAINPELNHQRLFLEVEPIFGRYCEELSKDYGDPQAFVLALYDENNLHPLEKVLGERLQDRVSEGKTVQEHLSQIVPLSPQFCSYEESFKEFVLKNQLLKVPSLSQGKVLRFIMGCQEQAWVLQESLTITFETFARLYKKYKQETLSLLKRFSELYFVADVKMVEISIKDPSLLYRAMQNTRDKGWVEDLIRGLLALGALKDKTTPDGSNLLHYAAIYCPSVIQVLIEFGLEYSLKNTQGKTPLDVAIETPNLLSMQALLVLGAGRYIALQNGLDFIKYYGNKGGLARQLLSQNVELAWELALQRASQEEETEEGVRLEGLGGRRYLTSELCKQVFKEGISAGFKKENLHGRHNVTSTQVDIGHNLSVGLHLKEKPELFGREIKVHYLAKHLFGLITPPIALWRFSKLEGPFWNKVPVGYPILASRSVTGNNLKEALEHYPNQLHNLDYESISEAILLALLVNPEDGRADNYILEPLTIEGKTRYRIVSIDNDRAFVSPLKIDKEGQEIEGSKGLQVKTILYCLDEMQMPLHPRVRERFLKIDPYQLLDTWLQDLEKAQKKIDNLFSAQEKESLKEKSIYLDIEFKPSIVADIYEKLLRIQRLLRKYPDSSGFTLLRHTIPNLSLRYIDAFSRYSTAMERFDALTPDCFDVQVVKGQQHLNTDIYVWPSSKVSLEQMPNIQGDAIIFVKEAVDNFTALQAYFIRNGKWVTSVEKAKPILRSVSVDFRTLGTFAVKPNGLVDVNEKNKRELAALIEQVMTKMRFNKEQKFSKTKGHDIIQMTKAMRVKELKMASEKSETPEVVRETLKELHQNLSNLKAIRDDLQEGRVLKFRGLASADQKEWIVNGKGVEFPGIDFAAMKLPNNQPDIAKQEKVLAALAETEFRTLRIQGCAALTDRALNNLLRNSRGLYALSLIDCPNLTDAVISNIKKLCLLLEKLELQGLNLLQIQESFPKLRVLQIKSCDKLTVWQGEVPNLNKCEIQKCALFSNQAFYSDFPFLLPLSKHLNRKIDNINIVMQNILKEKDISINLLPIEVKKKILSIINKYLSETSYINIEVIKKKLFNQIDNKETEARTAAHALSKFSQSPAKSDLKELNERYSSFFHNIGDPTIISSVNQSQTQEEPLDNLNDKKQIGKISQRAKELASPLSIKLARVADNENYSFNVIEQELTKKSMEILEEQDKYREEYKNSNSKNIKKRKDKKEHSQIQEILTNELFPSLDPDSKKLYEEILCLAEPKGVEGTQARVQGLKEPFHISIANARKILSQDAKGVIEKRNQYGHNLVSKVGNVYYTGNSERFLTEQAVYQISLLLGGGILSPTRLLIIEIPGEERIPIQASLAVQGENLENILRLPSGIAGLKEKLGTERFQQEFPLLLEELYLTDWLSNKGYDLGMSWERQLKLLSETVVALSLPERPKNFQDPKLTQEHLENELFYNLKGAPILATLALMVRYPELTRGIDFGDLLHIPELFKLLKRLYPKDTSEQILKQIPELFHRFLPENISKHFLLALLSEPADHKGDNFMVKVQHDANGKLQALEIIGIDNDMAGIDNEFGMAGSIRAWKSRNETRFGYEINVKSIFYGVKEFLGMSLNVTPPQFVHNTVVSWLGNMLQHAKPYLSLLTRGLYEAHYLHKQVLINFAERFALRLTKIQELVLLNPGINHQTLLLEVEPILGRYFQELNKDYPDPQSFVLVLYDKDNRHSLEKILAGRLQDKVSDGKNIKEHLSQIVPLYAQFCSYEESFKQFVMRCKLLQTPSELQEKVLEFSIACGGQTWLAQETLVLTFAVFARFYQKHRKAAIELLKSVTKIHFEGQSQVERIPLKDPALLYQAMKSFKDKELTSPLITGLLALGAVKGATTPDGSTLLHYAAVYSIDAIQPLIESGMECSIKNTQGKTALDLAIEAPNLRSVEILLALGFGRYARLENGLTFINKYYQNYADLCHQLLSQHPELAWELALQRASQEKETQEGVRLEGISGRRYLSSELCRQVFKDGVAAGFRKENPYGRHNVTSIRIDIAQNVSVGLHLKENPELPGREIMVHYLAKQLFGFITPPVALWRFSRLDGFWNKVVVGYPILASRSILGNNFKEALDYYPNQLQNMDYESVSEAIMLALLINPEDGRADNYILEPITVGGKIRYRIISIDNDHAFVSPLKIDKEGQEIEGPEGLQVKTILYCLDEMQMPVHPRVRERFLKIEPYQLLDDWLQDLQKVQEKIDLLFSAEEKESLKQKGIYLDIEFKPSIVINIYEKLLRIQMLLRKYPNSSAFTLLRYTIPNLSLRYIDIFFQYPTVLERFNALTSGHFDIQPVKWQNYSNVDIYIWPSSKVSLEKMPDFIGDAIVLIKEALDNRNLSLAYFVRNGKWVTSIEKGTAVLRSVSVDFRELASYSVKQDGLVDKNENNKKEFENFIKQTTAKMKLKREQEFTQTKTVDIIQITKVNSNNQLTFETEKTETPLVARASLKITHEQLVSLRVIRDDLQQGNVLKFRLVQLNKYQEWIVNGKSIDFPGIDFSKMNLPNNQPDIVKQERVLAALAEVEFRSLRIQGCAVLTDKALSNVLKNSKGLLSLSLMDCPKLTDAALSNIQCPYLESLELKGLNLVQVQESFPKLKMLKIKDCQKLVAWKGEVLDLKKLEITGCPLITNQDFYRRYPFFLSLSGHFKKDADYINTLIQIFLKNRNSQIRAAVLIALEEPIHKLSIEDLGFVIKILLSILNDSSFDNSVDVLAKSLNYFMSVEYINTIISSSISNFLSSINIVPVLTSSDSIIKDTNSCNLDELTMADGNCAMNAVALGICDLVLKNRGSLDNKGIKILINCLNPILLQKAGATLLAWLEKEADSDRRQSILASILRELAVDYIESHVDYYKESYEAGLLAAFEQYKLNQFDDAFSVHPHILKKFKELKAALNIRNQNSEIKGTKEEQETQVLLAWWNKGLGKNPSGFEEYLGHLKLPTRGTGDRERWGSKVEVGALAFRLGITITIKNAKRGTKVEQEQLLGIGYGCVLGLSEGEIHHLVNLGIGSRFQGGFRIEVADVQDLTRKLQLETLTEVEKEYLDKNGKETILAFMRNIRNCPVLEQAGLQKFCDKLKRIGLFVECENKSLRFVNDVVLKSRLTPVSEALKKKVLAAHIQSPCFTIEGFRGDWFYKSEEFCNSGIILSSRTSGRSYNSSVALPIPGKQSQELNRGATQKTVGNGDCAFHAVLGVWNGQAIECPQVMNVRKQLAEIIRGIDANSPMYPAVVEGIEQLLNEGRGFSVLRKKRAEYNAKNQQIIDAAWKLFEEGLRKSEQIMNFIKVNTKNVKELVELRNQFFYALNLEQGKLYGLISSSSALDEKFKAFTKVLNEGFNLVNEILADRTALNEYAEHIGRPEQWLLPCEFPIIAYAFDRNVKFYTYNPHQKLRSEALDINPNSKEKVEVCFDGVNHFERIVSKPPVAESDSVSAAVHFSYSSGSSASASSSSDSTNSQSAPIVSANNSSSSKDDKKDEKAILKIN
jgi:ankyrin repeat protein